MLLQSAGLLFKVKRGLGPRGQPDYSALNVKIRFNIVEETVSPARGAPLQGQPVDGLDKIAKLTINVLALLRQRPYFPMSKSWGFRAFSGKKSK